MATAKDDEPKTVVDLAHELENHDPWAGGHHCSCQERDEDDMYPPLPYWDRHLADVAVAYLREHPEVLRG